MKALKVKAWEGAPELRAAGQTRATLPQRGGWAEPLWAEGVRRSCVWPGVMQGEPGFPVTLNKKSALLTATGAYSTNCPL